MGNCICINPFKTNIPKIPDEISVDLTKPNIEFDDSQKNDYDNNTKHL